MKGCEVFERDPFIDLVKMFRCGRSKSEISCIESSLQKKPTKEKWPARLLKAILESNFFCKESGAETSTAMVSSRAVVTWLLVESASATCNMSATNLSSDSCFDDAAQSWLPNDKVFCGANFGWSDEDFQLNLPGFYPASSFTKRGSEIWLSDEDNGLKSWLGCGNHPGLVNGSRYCAQTSSNLDVGSITGDWGVLEDVSTVACYAYSVSEQAISVSFDPPLNLLLFHLFGYTFAPNAEVGEKYEKSLCFFCLFGFLSKSSSC